MPELHARAGQPGGHRQLCARGTAGALLSMQPGHITTSAECVPRRLLGSLNGHKGIGRDNRTLKEASDAGCVYVHELAALGICSLLQIHGAGKSVKTEQRAPAQLT